MTHEKVGVKNTVQLPPLSQCVVHIDSQAPPYELPPRLTDFLFNRRGVCDLITESEKYECRVRTLLVGNTDPLHTP